MDIRVLSGLDTSGTLSSTKLLELAREESVGRFKIVVGSDFERRIVSEELRKLDAELRTKVGIRVQSLRREVSSSWSDPSSSRRSSHVR